MTTARASSPWDGRGYLHRLATCNNYAADRQQDVIISLGASTSKRTLSPVVTAPVHVIGGRFVKRVQENLDPELGDPLGDSSPQDVSASAAFQDGKSETGQLLQKSSWPNGVSHPRTHKD